MQNSPRHQGLISFGQLRPSHQLDALTSVQARSQRARSPSRSSSISHLARSVFVGNRLLFDRSSSAIKSSAFKLDGAEYNVLARFDATRGVSRKSISLCA